MKKTFLFTVLLIIVVNINNEAVAQNVGIGTTEPMNKLQVQGNLLVTAPTATTHSSPTVAQTKTMPVLATATFLNTDSTGRIYDPGGPSGNYGLDLYSFASIPFSSNVGIEVTAEAMDLNTGDSLIIKTSSTGTVLLAVGNVYNSTGKWIFNSASLYFHFKSNVDFNTGAGFSLLFRRLYDDSPSLPDISGTVSGNAIFFDAKNGVLRSGLLNNAARGDYSVALGYSATATGTASIAMGYNTSAVGGSSFAMGFGSGALGSNSVAMGFGASARGYTSFATGFQVNASGDYATATGKYTDATGYASASFGDSSLASGHISFASGFRTSASGDFSTAMGRQAVASGDNSTAIGNYVSTNNQSGSFILGDNSTTTGMISPVSNYFAARFAGGYRLFTSSNYSTGVTLFAGDNAWTTASDVRKKENFAEVKGEDFLKKIAGFQLTSWNYKTQDPKKFRHYGPMAQDFYAAFGKDEYGIIGNDTTINAADFAGVSFIAIQALEKRTQKIDRLQKENEELKQTLLQMRKELDELKRDRRQNKVKDNSSFVFLK